MDDERIISAEEAEQILEPYADRLAACVRAGWEQWEELSRLAPTHLMAARPHTRASYVYDQMVDRARSEFEDDPNVLIREANQLFTLHIEGKLIIRFKKFKDSSGFETSGIPTMQRQLFAYQLPLPGMPHEATKVVAGYVLDEDRTSVASVAVACSDGPTLKWFHDLSDAGGEAATVEPIRPPAPTGPSKPRIKPKPAEQRDEASESR